MANQHKLIPVALGVGMFLVGCAEPCECLEYQETLGYHYKCAYFKDGYCQRTEAVPYYYDRCVKCAEGTTAAQ